MYTKTFIKYFYIRKTLTAAIKLLIITISSSYGRVNHSLALTKHTSSRQCPGIAQLGKRKHTHHISPNRVMVRPNSKNVSAAHLLRANNSSSITIPKQSHSLISNGVLKEKAIVFTFNENIKIYWIHFLVHNSFQTNSPNVKKILNKDSFKFKANFM